MPKSLSWDAAELLYRKLMTHDICAHAQLPKQQTNQKLQEQHSKIEKAAVQRPKI